MHELSSCEREAWRRFLSAHARVTEDVDKSLAESGRPSLGDLEVLLVLRCADGQRLRMSDLAEQVALSRSGLTRQVDRLVRKGLVERVTCPMDRRGTYAVLLPDGLRAASEALPVYAEAIRKRFLGPMDDSLNGLAVALQRLLDPVSANGCFEERALTPR